jgi:hypothetical protein
MRKEPGADQGDTQAIALPPDIPFPGVAELASLVFAQPLATQHSQEVGNHSVNVHATLTRRLHRLF